MKVGRRSVRCHQPALWDEAGQRRLRADGGDHSARGDGVAPVLQLDPDAAAPTQEKARHARAHEDGTLELCTQGDALRTN